MVTFMRDHFPLLKTSLIYFDNAATTLTPTCVIDKLREVYEEYPMNIHRGAYRLAEKASSEYELARKHIQDFIHAKSLKEIVLTKGTTESINLVAHSFGVEKGDEILITAMEHHSNILPWKTLCDKTGALLKVIPMTAKGELDLEAFEQLLSPKVRLVSVVHISNVLGTVNPIEKIITRAHQCGAKVLVDAAQSAPHVPIDVQKLDVDCLCFSAHKVFGSFGVGVLYVKEEILEAMIPYQEGGGVIDTVSFDEITYAPLPNRFEAGTPPIASIIAFGKALQWIAEIGFDEIAKAEKALAHHLFSSLENLSKIQVYSNPQSDIPLAAFSIEGMHPHDVSTFLDQKDIAIRSGHLCAQPIMHHFGVPSMCRASLSFYNTCAEIDAFVEGLQEIEEIL